MSLIITCSAGYEPCRSRHSASIVKNRANVEIQTLESFLHDHTIKLMEQHLYAEKNAVPTFFQIQRGYATFDAPTAKKAVLKLSAEAESHGITIC
jgi:hypothetical protein